MQLELQGLVIHHRFPWRNAREIMTYDPIVYDPNAQCKSIYKPGFSVSLDNWRFRPIANSPPKSFNLFVMAEQTSFLSKLWYIYINMDFLFLSQTLDCESTLSCYETLWRIFTLKETTNISLTSLEHRQKNDYLGRKTNGYEWRETTPLTSEKKPNEQTFHQTFNQWICSKISPLTGLCFHFFTQHTIRTSRITRPNNRREGNKA